MRRSSGSSSEPNGAIRAGPTSSRWLSIRRRACSAYSSPTVTRSSFSEKGNAVRAMSEVTMARMPWASSRPQTTSASIGDGVRKTTIRSDMPSCTLHCDPRGNRDRLDLHQDHRHVVVLVGCAHEGLDLAEDPLAQLAGVEVAVLLHDVAQALVAEQVTVQIHGLGDAVRVQHDDVAWIEA